MQAGTRVELTEGGLIIENQVLGQMQGKMQGILEEQQTVSIISEEDDLRPFFILSERLMHWQQAVKVLIGTRRHCRFHLSPWRPNPNL